MLESVSMVKENAFDIEKKRQVIASKKKLSELKDLYHLTLPGVKNINSSKFWDEKISPYLDHTPYDGMTRERVEIAYKFLPNDAKKVLDIGAGYGYVERILDANKNIEIFGNDISKNAIHSLRKRFRGHFKIESLYNMRYKKDFFDAVFMLEVLEHIPPSKTFKVLGDINKILRKRGYFIVSVPTNEGLEILKDNPSGHVRMYTEDLIQAELKLAGFKILSVKTLYAFKDLYVFKKIISKIFKNRWKPNDIIVLAQSI